MSELVPKRKLKKEEAEQKTTLFVAYGNAMRWTLLELYEGDAHEALGYTTFEEYAAARLGLFYSTNHFDKLMRAARVERTVIGQSQSNLIEAAPEHRPKMSITTALELAKLPTPELQRQTYNEMETMRGFGYRTEAEILRGLKQLVKGKLGQEQGESATTKPQTPALPPAPEQKVYSAPLKFDPPAEADRPPHPADIPPPTDDLEEEDVFADPPAAPLPETQTRHHSTIATNVAWQSDPDALIVTIATVAGPSDILLSRKVLLSAGVPLWEEGK